MHPRLRLLLIINKHIFIFLCGLGCILVYLSIKLGKVCLIIFNWVLVFLFEISEQIWLFRSLLRDYFLLLNIFHFCVTITYNLLLLVVSHTQSLFDRLIRILSRILLLIIRTTCSLIILLVLVLYSIMRSWCQLGLITKLNCT